MKLCKICHTYQAMPIPDKTKPSQYAKVADQSDADTVNRFLYVYPTTPGALCYYCTAKASKRISESHS